MSGDNARNTQPPTQGVLNLFRDDPVAPVELTDAEMIEQYGPEAFQQMQYQTVLGRLQALGSDLIDRKTRTFRPLMSDSLNLKN